ncbi:MAG: chemotaxis protein, partial [Butyrivibrio sp.]
PYQKVTPVPNAHPFVEGIIMPRDTMLTVVDLTKVTGARPSSSATDMLIITNFNKLNIAFRVHRVCSIHRVSWADIISPDATISSAGHGVTTGVIKIDGRLIVILDFEHIVNDISPETGLKVHEIDRYSTRTRNDIPIFLAEDSSLLMTLIADSLRRAGYSNLTLSPNGQECWNKLTELAQSHKDNISQYVRCVITDIEMPKMDGHHLTKLIKTDSVLNTIPVVIFSSLISDEMRRKGEQLGADIQLSKPEIGRLVEELDKLLLK